MNEYEYRVDRLLSTLMLCGALQRVAGVVLGAFNNCEPGDGKYGTLTLDEVFDDYFVKPLKVPVYSGALLATSGASSRCRWGWTWRWMPMPERCVFCSRRCFDQASERRARLA